MAAAVAKSGPPTPTHSDPRRHAALRYHSPATPSPTAEAPSAEAAVGMRGFQDSFEQRTLLRLLLDANNGPHRLCRAFCTHPVSGGQWKRLAVLADACFSSNIASSSSSTARSRRRGCASESSGRALSARRRRRSSAIGTPPPKV